MNGAQYHRGPDGGGTWLSRFAVLAHRRLAVIDVQNGAQPMAFPGTPDSEARLVLTYNGELYNYRELRKELEARGHRFRTAGDTEVVLTAWAEWGPKAVERFNGIFAFAVWDAEDRALWLVRDHLGVKPLHYHRDGGRLVFGSEAKAVLAHPEVETAVDEDGLRQLALPCSSSPEPTPTPASPRSSPGTCCGSPPTG
ncbi:asparagine synthetase B family protein [Nocardiopsis composta]